MEACPTPDIWFETDKMGTELEAHIDECTECRRLAAMIARLGLVGSEAESGGDTAAALDPEFLGVGTTLGRYVVRGAIGVGGMGVVLEAYDSQLDRTVALKLVRRLGNSSIGQQSRQRVLKEAKAMARLAHPNVVAIHELVEIGDELLIAMEHVVGADLSSWLSESPRSEDERLQVMLQAGRGLAAAHDAGVIHRDIKPTNILVGTDGRVRVTDFGLAIIDGVSSDAGTFIGTRAYAAPECAQRPPDASSDQYSFALTTWELLYGSSPVVTERGRVSFIAVALRRAMLEEPDQRYSSMAQLVAALEPPRKKPNRRAVLGLSGVAVVASIVAVVMLARGGKPSLQYCTPDNTKFAEVWSPQARAAWILNLDALAGDGARPLAKLIDAKWESWKEAGVAACEAKPHRSDGESGSTECLAAIARQLAAVTQHAASAEHLDKISIAIEQVPDARACLDAPPQKQVDLEPESLAIRKEIIAGLDEVSAMSWLGQYQEAREHVEKALVRVPVGDEALRGALLYRGADLAARMGDPGAAVPQLQEALLIAERASNDVARLNVMILLLGMYEESGKLKEAMALATVAEAAAQRVLPDSNRATRLANMLGAIAYDAGDFGKAERHYREVLALTHERFPNAEDPELAGALTNLGMAVHAQGRNAEAIEIERQALAMFEATLGPHHDNTALPVSLLGDIALEERRLDDASELYQRVIDIRVVAFGPEHPFLSEPVLGLARVLIERKQHSLAFSHLERARALAAQIDTKHPLTAVCDYYIAMDLHRRGKSREAASTLGRASEVFQDSGIALAEAHLSSFLLAKYRWAAGHKSEAKELATLAHAGLLKMEGQGQHLESIANWLQEHP
ncbi:MAG: serine/threonine protein kinase [Halieaceae bacterium]|nr:serine/threonine protein kinase [Halieaceae bacterium]